MRNFYPILSCFFSVITVQSCAVRQGNSKKIFAELNCALPIQIKIDDSNRSTFEARMENQVSNLSKTDYYETKELFIASFDECRSNSEVDVQLKQQLGFQDKSVIKAEIRIAKRLQRHQNKNRDVDFELQYRMLGQPNFISVSTTNRNTSMLTASVLPQHSMKIAVRDLVQALFNEQSY